MAGQVEDFTPGGVFAGDNINFTVNTSSSSTTTDKYVVRGTLQANNKLRLIYNDDTVIDTDIDLSSLAGGGGGTDTNNYVTAANFDPDSNILTLNREGLGNVTVDLSALAGGGTDTNDYVDSIAIDPGTDQLRLGRTGELSDLTVSLTQFANIDNQISGANPIFTQGDYTYSFNGNVLTVTSAEQPSPVFTPEESNPDPVNALDETEVVFDAPEANEGFVIDDVSVSSIEVKDTDGVNISSDTNIATVNDDNTITVDFSTLDNDHAISEIDLEVTVTDSEGDSVTLNPVADIFVPYYTLASDTDYTSITTFQTDATASTEAIGSSVTIDGVGQGRKKYWIMTNGTYTFMQQGFTLEADIVVSGKIGQYTYNLYDLGEFGNPFDSTEDSPDITLDVS